jgi:hypothetical protein
MAVDDVRVILLNQRFYAPTEVFIVQLHGFVEEFISVTVKLS